MISSLFILALAAQLAGGATPSQVSMEDMNAAQWSAALAGGNCRFLTKRLWGAANEPPFFHHGMFTTLRQAVLAHAGEAAASTAAFNALTPYEQDCVIEFLKSLQVLPPGTRYLVVDERGREREWPPHEEIKN